LYLQIIDKILNNNELVDVSDLHSLLSISDDAGCNLLHTAARRVKKTEVGSKVYLRGLIELSNICAKDCKYCGIRKSNTDVKRYQLSFAEIEDSASWAWKHGFASLVLQAGERRSPGFIDYIEAALIRINEVTKGELTITLSLGEQNLETYRRWFKAGASRYLLRVETTNSNLYSSLHPEDHDYNERLVCLSRLRETGFQVGTGVMMGLPGQNIEDLAKDLIFFKQHDIDMIGMGPFIPHNETPMAGHMADFDNAM